MKFPTKNKASTAVLCFCLAGLAAYGGTRRRYGRDFKKKIFLTKELDQQFMKQYLRIQGYIFVEFVEH